MKILNVHQRTINQPKSNISPLLATLSTPDDAIWPKGKWPPMRFKDGLKVGAKGGHGPIRYSIEKYMPGDLIQFRFSKPSGFDGVHRFEIKEIDEEHTEIKHVVDAEADFRSYLSWVFVIRWLHDAVVEDAFDRLENRFLTEKKTTRWSLWVKFWRSALKPPKKLKSAPTSSDYAG